MSPFPDEVAGEATLKEKHPMMSKQYTYMALQHCQSGRASKNSTSSKEDKNNQVQRTNILLSLKHNFHEFSEFEALSHYSHIIIPFYL